MLIAVPWAFQERGRSVPKLPLLFQMRSNRLCAEAFQELSRANPNGAGGFVSAVENSQGAINALLRNPTCGAHKSVDGIHPPGNP